MLNPDDKRLVARYNDATRHLSPYRAAAETGISEATVRRLRNTEKPPTRITSDVRVALMKYLGEAAPSYRPGASEYVARVVMPAEERVLAHRIGPRDEEVAEPNYESLGIDLPGYDKLLERPRKKFDRFMLSLIGRGLGREDLEELGRGLLAPIAHMNTIQRGEEESDADTEEDQLLILEGLIPQVWAILERRQR